jgi:hypothetical protein
MAVAGIREDVIARCLGCDLRTLRKYFREELDCAAPKVTALATRGLTEAIRKGEPWAIRFWLRTRAGFVEKSEHEILGPGGGPLQLESCELHELSDVELESEIVRLARATGVDRLLTEQMSEGSEQANSPVNSD